MEVRVATIVRERPALDDAALMRISHRVALVQASDEAISNRPRAGKLSFGFHPMSPNRGLLALHGNGANAIVHAAQDMIR